MQRSDSSSLQSGAEENLILLFLVSCALARLPTPLPTPLFRRRRHHPPATMASLPLSSLKHIQSVSFTLTPLARSSGSRALRLLLSRLPSKVRPDLASAAGLSKLPDVVVKTVADEEQARVEVVYASKEKLEIKPGKGSTMGIAELIRKVSLERQSMTTVGPFRADGMVRLCSRLKRLPEHFD